MKPLQSNIPATKVAIGGAQFGFKYGVAPNANKVDEHEVGNILKSACNSGINFIDTARVYGESEEVIGRKAEKYFKIVSKCIVKPGYDLPDVSLEKSLEALGYESLYGYLVHGPELLFEVPSAWETLEAAKASGKVQKIGFSLYKPELLFKLMDAGMLPDLIQVQYNLLDRRFEPYFKELSDAGIEIHVRSAFIQGLFFLQELPYYLRSIEDTLTKIKQAYPDQKELAAALLSFCICNDFIDKTVIGLNNKAELDLNMRGFIEKNSNKLFNLMLPEIEDEVLLPYNWPIYKPKT